jgi:hypothetical protein
MLHFKLSFLAETHAVNFVYLLMLHTDKKENEIVFIYKEFRWDQLQSHV